MPAQTQPENMENGQVCMGKSKKNGITLKSETDRVTEWFLAKVRSGSESDAKSLVYNIRNASSSDEAVADITSMYLAAESAESVGDTVTACTCQILAEGYGGTHVCLCRK